MLFYLRNPRCRLSAGTEAGTLNHGWGDSENNPEMLGREAERGQREERGERRDTCPSSTTAVQSALGGG